MHMWRLVLLTHMYKGDKGGVARLVQVVLGVACVLRVVGGIKYGRGVVCG
jgi:hypothetical protein